MTESDSFWDLYWEVRLRDIETLGKRSAIIAASGLVRRIATATGKPVRLLELGCGEGEIIGPLVEAHAQYIHAAVGVDYNREAIAVCKTRFPGITFIEGDFTAPELLHSLEPFDLILLVNALHEVFSAAYSAELGEVDVDTAKARVAAAFTVIAGRLAQGGYMLLFDGLEPPSDPSIKVRLRFLDTQARRHFETFAAEYRPFQVNVTRLDDPQRVELFGRDFTRYITKSIFLGKALWKSERLESYQYFTEGEFRALAAQHELSIEALQLLTLNEEKWQRAVEIETPGIDFPVEHILMVLRKSLDR